MSFENLGGGALEYFPCRYGKSKLLFRGPKRSLKAPYVAVLGGTETYGKFVPSPFPALVEQSLDLPLVNFGCVNAGIDVFVNDPTVLQACDNAVATVVQLTGAHNLSNRLYAVHPRRNDRFLRASNLLKSIYREIDFTEFHFTRHLLAALKQASEEKFSVVEQELMEAWVARMKTLISKISGKIILLWFADHYPEEGRSQDVLATDPAFINRQMIAEIKPFVTDLVEVVVDTDEISAGMSEMVYSDLEAPVASGMLGTVAHQRAALMLEEVLRLHAKSKSVFS